jgi:hypothetical protein
VGVDEVEPTSDRALGSRRPIFPHLFEITLACPSSRNFDHFASSIENSGALESPWIVNARSFRVLTSAGSELEGRERYLDDLATGAKLLEGERHQAEAKPRTPRTRKKGSI